MGGHLTGPMGKAQNGGATADADISREGAMEEEITGHLEEGERVA